MQPSTVQAAELMTRALATEDVERIFRVLGEDNTVLLLSRCDPATSCRLSARLAGGDWTTDVDAGSRPGFIQET
jgi:hypothetical protein